MSKLRTFKQHISSPQIPSSGDPQAAACVYFDGGCPVCAREINTYQRLSIGSDLAFCDVSASPDAPAGDLLRDAAMARFHVRLHSGELVSGARAFLALWRKIPKLRWLARLLSIPPIPLMLEAGYRLFLKLRVVWR